MKRTLMLTRQIADSGQTIPLNGDVGDGAVIIDLNVTRVTVTTLTN